MQTLEAKKRTSLSKSTNKRIRREGGIPAVVYGKKIGSTAVQVPEIAFLQLVKQEGKNALFNLQWDDTQSTVMINELQAHPIKENVVLHVDFLEVNVNQEITTEVPIEWVGESIGEKDGGVLQKQYQAVEVRCIASNIPDTIKVDLSELKIGETIKVGDLHLEDGISIELEDDSVLVSVLAPTLGDDTLDDVPGEGQEPELVGAESDEDNE